MRLAITMLIEFVYIDICGSNTECSFYILYTQNDIEVLQSTEYSNFSLNAACSVTGQMTQTKFWGSEVCIYACGPRGGSLQILGPGARRKPAYVGRGLTITTGVKMWGGAWRKARSRGLQK